MNSLPLLACIAASLSLLASCTTTTTEGDSGGSQDVSAIENKLTSTAFAIADKNGDQSITYQELVAANPDSTEERFRMTDADSSGTLSADELEIGIDRRGGFLTLISKVDLDNDGLISKSESERFDRAIAGADKLDTFDQLKRILD